MKIKKTPSTLDRPTTSTTSAGLIGSSLTAIAATGFALGNPAMEGLMSGSLMNQNQDNVRRASTPSTSTSSSTPASGSGGGGFSSIFNLKSVISAATKSNQQQQQPPVPTTNANFYVPSPVATLSDQTTQLESHASQKSVQGSLNLKKNLSMCSHLFRCCCCCCGYCPFSNSICFLFCFDNFFSSLFF